MLPGYEDEKEQVEFFLLILMIKDLRGIRDSMVEQETEGNETKQRSETMVKPVVSSFQVLPQSARKSR